MVASRDSPFWDALEVSGLSAYFTLTTGLKVQKDPCLSRSPIIHNGLESQRGEGGGARPSCCGGPPLQWSGRDVNPPFISVA